MTNLLPNHTRLRMLVVCDTSDNPDSAGNFKVYERPIIAWDIQFDGENYYGIPISSEWLAFTEFGNFTDCIYDPDTGQSWRNRKDLGYSRDEAIKAMLRQLHNRRVQRPAA